MQLQNSNIFKYLDKHLCICRHKKIWHSALIASCLSLTAGSAASRETSAALSPISIYQHMNQTTQVSDFIAEFGKPAQIDIPMLVWPAFEKQDSDFMTRAANGYWAATYEPSDEKAEEIAVIMVAQPKVVKQTSALIDVVPQLVVIWPLALSGLDIETINCMFYCSREHIEQLIQTRSTLSQPQD